MDGAWNELADGVWWREYTFGRGAWATTLAFRGVDGIVVVSPASGMDAGGYDALAHRRI